MSFRALVVPLVVLAALASIPAWAQPGPPPSAQQTPARDNARPAQGAAVIRGTVTAAAGGQPLYRVRITLNGPMTNPPTAVTDSRGAYEFTEVPAGSYTLTATRAGYLTVRYGQRRSGDAGRSVIVGNAEAVEGVDLALPRAAVLAGRVTDDLGEPVPGARVEAVETRYVRGRRIAVAARQVRTNDVGEYRLGDLEPGGYQIRASIRDMWESDDGQATFTYAITYFPGVTAAARPQTVNVSAGQVVVGLDFALVPGRAARITGVVMNANGEPAAGQVVNLDTIARAVGGGVMSAGPGGSTRTDANGAFDFPKLPAGEYNAYSGGPNDTVAEPVVVQPGESKHVVLTVRKPTATVGSIVTDEGTAPPFLPGRIAIVPISTDPENVLPAWGAPRETSPRADWTFRFPNMEGQFVFRVTRLPDDWMLKSVMLGRRDVTDSPVTIRRGGPDLQGLQVILSNKAARITGEVLDRAGARTADATIVVFAENRTLWGLGSRFTHVVRPDRNGRFSIGGLPPGAYRAIACDVLDGQWEDPDFLQTLVKQATRVELAEGASEKISLTFIAEAVR